tara:strand:+ start:286 stop:642 length:357 start_codon:yes stop_codon:yes gene_type:complete
MSATFYPAKQKSANVWTFVEVPYEVNLSNSNARLVLSDLGLQTEFEYANTKEQEIDDFIERCHQVLRGAEEPMLAVDCDLLELERIRREERYVLHKVAMLLVSATLGKQNGATHWYFA